MKLSITVYDRKIKIVTVVQIIACDCRNLKKELAISHFNAIQILVMKSTSRILQVRGSVRVRHMIAGTIDNDPATGAIDDVYL